jgi:radical SAM superfamily enzyme YgiQ (UPF0313 family)
MSIIGLIRMRIALVIPRNRKIDKKSFYDYKFIKDFTFSKKQFSYLLSIPVLLSLTPDEHEVRVFDENIEDIDYDWSADIVGITVRTMFAVRAYHIADNFHQRGIKTVLGGIHPSMCNEEALQFCDSIVIGEAENVWQDLLKDAQAGQLKRIYKAKHRANLTAFPKPVRSKLSLNRYLADILQTTKGCPFQCEFCSVYSYDGQRIRHKSIEQVLKEITEISNSTNSFKKKAVFFADDNIISDKKYARELFSAIKSYNLNWSCQAAINVSKDDDLLKLMKESGCGAILIGFESISDENLRAMGKAVNLRNDYAEAINKIQSHGILVHSSFIMGYDYDTPKAFDDLIEFIVSNRLLMPLINILTPFPGTKLFSRFEQEGRIIHKNWNEYDSETVVFRPSLMTPEELTAEFKRVIRKVYSFDSIYQKLEHYWNIDFWNHQNRIDPIKYRYRLLFAFRLISLLFSLNVKRSNFILKILLKVFDGRVRLSTILTLMAYNDYAYNQ